MENEEIKLLRNLKKILDQDEIHPEISKYPYMDSATKVWIRYNDARNLINKYFKEKENEHNRTV
jgi:hypothetical protein